MTREQIKNGLQELETLLRSGNEYVQCEAKARELLEQLARYNHEDSTRVDTELRHLHFRICYALSYSLWQRGLSREALVSAQEALDIATDLGDVTLLSKAFNNMGNVSWQLHEYARSQEYYIRALEIAEESGNKRDIASALSNIGNVCMETDDLSAAQEYYKKSIAAYEDQDYIPGVAHVLGSLGTLHVRLAEFPQALECYMKAAECYEELSNKGALASILGNAANVYADLSDHSTALEYYARALSLHEELGNRSGIADVNGNMGTVYLELSDPASALGCFRASLAIHEELGNKAGVAFITSQIGNAHSELHEYASALQSYFDALQEYRDLDSRRGEATVTGNIGSAYLHLGDYTRALDHLSEALVTHVELADTIQEAGVASTIGVVYAKEDYVGCNLLTAVEYLQRALTLAESAGVLQLQSRCHKELATICERQERWKEFAVHFKQFYNLEQQVKSDEAKKKATLMEHRRLAIEQEKLLAVEREHARTTTAILYQVLPQSIADRLIRQEKVADYFSQLSILFADIVGFTPIAARMPAKAVLAFLNYVFAEFDKIMEKHGCQKIKTIGDGYMAVCGAPIPCDDHAERLARAALELMNGIEVPETLRQTLPKGSVFHLRIGLHTGSAFAGIVGEKGFVYDVYSDAVNIASRMESSGEAGKIHCSADFAHHLQNRNETFVFEERDEIEIKGKGMMRTYFLERMT